MYDYDFNHLIKIISKEKIVHDKTEYQNVIEKCVFSNRKTFKSYISKNKEELV